MHVFLVCVCVLRARVWGGERDFARVPCSLTVTLVHTVWADSDAYNAAKSSAMAAAQPTVRGADAKAQTPAEEPANKRQKM